MCAPQAVHVEDMVAGQLLVARPRRQVLPANDADAVAASQVLRGSVPEPLIHVGRHAPVAQKVRDTVPEVSERPVQVTHLPTQA